MLQHCIFRSGHGNVGSDFTIDVRLANKSLLLKELAAKAAISLGLSPEQVEPYLPKREELGSTSIGGGVAIPHARLPYLQRSYACWRS